MERVTLKMIAERAGVSVATVSMALRNRGAISAARSEEIRALATKMGYVPNPLFSSLASKRFRTAKSFQGTPLAILDFPSLPGTREGPNSYAKSLALEAKNLGYSPTVHTFPILQPQQREQFTRILYHRMVQGLVIVGSLDESLLSKDFDWAPFSVVQCARYVEANHFHTVRPNIYQAVKLAFTKLRDRGYRRIGFAIGRHDPPMEDDEARYGAAVAMETGYLPKRDQLPIYLGGIHDQGAFLAWVAKTKPDAVVGFSTGFYWDLKDHGYRIPEEMGFVSLHLSLVERAPIKCSGLSQNQEEISRQSILLLDQLIRNRERGKIHQPLHILVPSEWHAGETLKDKIA